MWPGDEGNMTQFGEGAGTVSDQQGAGEYAVAWLVDEIEVTLYQPIARY